MRKAGIPRRRFLGRLAAASGVMHAGTGLAAIIDDAPAGSLPPGYLQKQLGRRIRPGDSIDRSALVTRHCPVLRAFEPRSPLSLGNGEFAFTADITGLQTFPEQYENTMPLCTMSQWGWHTTPRPSGLEHAELRLTPYETHGRQVGYQTSAEGQTELYNWLRENPHRLNLARIGLKLITTNQKAAQAAEISDIEQKLDLWSGKLTSRFKFAGLPIIVQTSVHPELDLLAISIESNLITEGRLAVRLAFPYGSPNMQASDWNQPTRHQSRLMINEQNQAAVQRTVDADQYSVVIAWAGAGSFAAEDAHSFLFVPALKSSTVEITVAFSPRGKTASLPDAQATFNASAAHWQRFWQDGAAIELSGSEDTRAEELERRIVLSQYLTAIQCAGSQPPQETGLTVNSWYGKFHLEMHWWHAAHFALWNRLPLLEKSLGWYQSILPVARQLAKSQGYTGARWPKMVGPEGRDSPSPIGPLLIWQQPHPIFYAELCYQVRPTRETLQRYREIVFESAEFLSSYAFFDPPSGRYVLGPPLIPAQENHPPRETWNPTFELSYWTFALKLAQRWRERLGLKPNSNWDQVILKLSQLPTRDGVYLAHENCPQTYSERNYDHPSMLGAFGVLPGDGVDHETMRRTLKKAMREWQWDKTWGWDYPLAAMTAARLGEPNVAVEFLLMKTEKNSYAANGHNWQRENLPCYLPGNGGLLYAVALMAGGWQGAPQKPAPGFPADGTWNVRTEKMNSKFLRQS